MNSCNVYYIKYPHHFVCLMRQGVSEYAREYRDNRTVTVALFNIHNTDALIESPNKFKLNELIIHLIGRDTLMSLLGETLLERSHYSAWTILGP